MSDKHNSKVSPGSPVKGFASPTVSSSSKTVHPNSATKALNGHNSSASVTAGVRSSAAKLSSSKKPTLLQRISSSLPRPKVASAPISDVFKNSAKHSKPKLENTNRIRSEPTIETIRASPEEMRGPSAANGEAFERLGRQEDRDRLMTPPPGASPRSSPRHNLVQLERSRSGRSSTSPIPTTTNPAHLHKRLILCCDGTWQDGLAQNRRWRYSNVLKLSRCIAHEDERTHPATPQIVFYQSGLGTQDHIFGQLVDGAFGAHLAEKVMEGYAWLAQNYCHGDDIMLFGFSRGAYTARMIAAFIGELGLLSRTEMDSFADLFVAYQKRGKTDSAAERAKYDNLLKPFQDHASAGRRKFEHCKFSVKVVGVFDTVGSLGLPAEFTRTTKMKTLFDFPDKILGEHIERAYHAIAINEERADFNVTKFHQTKAGKEKGQLLRQMWMAGSHSDVGGGFQDHDLSDISLVWMIAEIEDVLAIDLKYLKAIPRPVNAWGTQVPHYSRGGIFAIGSTVERQIEPNNPETCERIHISVKNQVALTPGVITALRDTPNILQARLLPLEEEIQQGWTYKPGETPPRQDSSRARTEKRRETQALESIREAAKKARKKGVDVFDTALISGGEAVEEGLELVASGLRQTPTHQDSSVASVWDEILSW